MNLAEANHIENILSSWAASEPPKPTTANPFQAKKGFLPSEKRPEPAKAKQAAAASSSSAPTASSGLRSEQEEDRRRKDRVAKRRRILGENKILLPASLRWSSRCHDSVEIEDNEKVPTLPFLHFVSQTEDESSSSSLLLDSSSILPLLVKAHANRLFEDGTSLRDDRVRGEIGRARSTTAISSVAHATEKKKKSLADLFEEEFLNQDLTEQQHKVNVEDMRALAALADQNHKYVQELAKGMPSLMGVQQQQQQRQGSTA